LTVRIAFGILLLVGETYYLVISGQIAIVTRGVKGEDSMSASIEQLRVYKLARAAEDQVYELVKSFPAEDFYGSGNDLRRSSAAVAHHIMETHRLFSYRLRLDALAMARREAETTQKHLEGVRDLGATDALISDYTAIIKQSWGLTKWLRVKLDERQEKAEVAAKEELAQAVA
jgi:four helix bundle protein